MPDLSHRPTRYAVTAVTVAALAAGAAFDPPRAAWAPTPSSRRRGSGRRGLRRRTARSGAGCPARPPRSHPRTQPRPWPRRRRTAPGTGPRKTRNAAFVADPVGLRSLDGDGDGTACEQLKSASAAVPSSTVPGDGSTTGDASTDEPSPPQQEELAPAGPTIPDVPSKAEIVASGHHFGIADGHDRGVRPARVQPRP